MFIFILIDLSLKLLITQVALRDMGSDLSSLESKLNKHVATNDGQLEVK